MDSQARQNPLSGTHDFEARTYHPTLALAHKAGGFALFAYDDHHLRNPP